MISRRRFLIVSASSLAAPRAARASTSQVWRGMAMGAAVTLRVSGATNRQARAFFERAEAELIRAERLFSLYRDSDLTRLNGSGVLRNPRPEMVEMMALSARLNTATDGAFDPSVQPVWLARAQGRDEQAVHELTGWQKTEWSADEIRLPRRGMGLTFNGIAQGWVADRLAQAAVLSELPDVLIDSGELRAVGPQGWDTGIADAHGHLVKRLTLRERALASSSPMGTRIGPAGDLPHIVAPGGGECRYETVSVSAPAAVLADGLSTAFCVMEPQAIHAALGSFPGCRLELLNEWHAKSASRARL
ncbi:FAD:protein FMN transferase [Paracoccus aerodenitrificans]|uniref:FAD:protein FMN transferase n=1 Tax=Paracoccus aerodenitrificans TaxID=3017781 RepID=UPI0022F0BF0E|nr:FAD:protein FMN transferase [Paracoccus aerodenitrificans]WBU62781.1 FAD:protein FMN transferase [Paracoccus aerodenitrificans]